jgi:signal transduction histidine kinase
MSSCASCAPEPALAIAPERSNASAEPPDPGWHPLADTATLRSQLVDLIATLALPAVWSGRDAAGISEALLEVLSSMLRLDLAYIRVGNPAGSRPLEVARVEGRPNLGEGACEIAGLLAESRTRNDASQAFVLPHPVTGEPLRAARIVLGPDGPTEVIIAASRRSSFPTPHERFLLQSIVAQAKIALRSAGLMTAVRHTLDCERVAREDAEAATRAKDKLNEELESRVVERTVRLTLINEALKAEIAERKRAERRLAAQYTIARVLAEADGLTSATPSLLQAIGQSMEWEWGALWKVDHEAGVLRCESTYHAPDLEAAEFDTVSRGMTFTPGRGLPGLVWQTGKPLWIADATTEASYVRARIATKVGLRGAIAFSIGLSGETLGVIEFLSRTMRPPDEEQLETFGAIGSMIGQFIERRRAEEALRQAQAELAHVSRVTTLGELAASIAHEINQPLAAIMADANACLHWLAADLPDLDSVREALVAVVTDGNRAAEVISRIRALLSRSAVVHHPCDLAGVIRDVLPLVRPEMERHGIVLETSSAPDLPRVKGDRIQLQQVLLNLLVNAVEASREVPRERRRVVVRSTVEDRNDGPWAVVAVQDAGVGFREPEVTRLFEAFYTTKPGGLGMGLSISRSIVDAHGGQLSATANSDHGAVFCFALPGMR